MRGRNLFKLVGCVVGSGMRRSSFAKHIDLPLLANTNIPAAH